LRENTGCGGYGLALLLRSGLRITPGVDPRASISDAEEEAIDRSDVDVRCDDDVPRLPCPGNKSVKATGRVTNWIERGSA